MSVAQESEVRHPVKRAKVSFNLDKDDEDGQKDKGPIPIVELKPFVHKVWRREKSLPGFYDKMDINLERASPRSMMSKSSRDGDTFSEVLSQSEMSISPPPRTSHSLPPRFGSHKILVYVNTFNDFNSQKEHFHKYVGESGYRPKSRIHPTTDYRTINKQPEYSANIIPGFITRDDRTKSTLTEITLGESMRKSFDIGAKSPNPDGVKRFQAMRVVGEPIRNDVDVKMSPKATSPARSLNSSWQSVRHGSPASVLYKPRPIRSQVRSKTPLYDHLDREGTLPSLTVTAPGLNQRSNVKYCDKESDDYMDINEAYERKYAHSIGGIENSLKLLSKHGKPTKVERQLSRELESNLSRLRKAKEVSPFEVNPSEVAKYFPQNQAFNPTRGELLIREGLKSNAPKRFRDSKRMSRDFKLFSQSTLEATQGILKKHFREIEHLDSYDQEVLDIYKADTNETGVDGDRTVDTGMTDVEPTAPHDTPRTGPESQLSLIKTSEELMQEREDVGESPYGQRSSTDRDTVVSTVYMNGVSNGRIGGKLEPQTLGLDKDGRTFITSESGAHAQVALG